MKRVHVIALVVALLGGCTSEPDRPVTRALRVAAARAFTQHYSQTRLSAWNVRGSAAGNDCGVLFVEASMILEDSLIDALHHGTGHYAVYEGGVQSFSRQRHFRGVAYKDSTGYLWAYGSVTAAEAKSLEPCH